MKSVLNTILHKEEAENHKKQVEETEAAGEKTALKKQTLQVTAMESAAADRLSEASGAVQHLLQQNLLLKEETVEAALREKTVAKKAKAEHMIRVEDTGKVATLKVKMKEADAKMAQGMAEQAKTEGQLAKTDAVNGALKESLMREIAMNNETAKEFAKVNEAKEKADIDKLQLESTVSAEASDLSSLRQKNTNQSAVLAVDSAKLASSRAAVANTMSGVEKGSKDEKEVVQREEKQLSGINAKRDAGAMKMGELKAKLVGKQALQQAIQLNLDELKTDLETAEVKLKTAQETRTKMQGKVQETKENAGQTSRDLEAKKMALESLEQSKRQAQAEGAAEVAAIKARIADAQEAQTNAKSGIEELSNKMKVMDEDNTQTETKTSKMETEISLKEKELQVLQKKQSVLKAFLSGPLLSGAEDGAQVTDTNAEEEVPVSSAEEPQQLMESLPELPPL